MTQLNRDDSEEEIQENASKILEDFEGSFGQLFVKFQKKITKSSNKTVRYVKKLKSTTKTAQTTADAAKELATTAQQEASKVATDLEMVKKDLGLIDARPDDYQLSQFIHKYRSQVRRYNKHIKENRRFGNITINVLAQNKDKYINNADAMEYSVNVGALERDINAKIDTAANKVKLVDARATRKRNDKFKIAANLDGRFNDRRRITEWLITNRFKFAGLFGIRLSVPEEYIIDGFLTDVQKDVKDPESNLPIILSWDLIKAGKYILFLNDYDRVGSGWNRNDDSDKAKRDAATRLIIASPMDFLDIHKKNMTLKNLQLAADKENYFIYNGNVLPIPDKYKN